MEPAESYEQKEVTLRSGMQKSWWYQDALDALYDEMLRGDPILSTWYKSILYGAQPTNATGQALIRWWEQRQSGKLNQDTASGSEIDMSQVIATVGTIDPTSVCEDPGCAQRGEMFKDHKVVHKPKGIKKGLRGVCPKCEGPMHNLKDDSRLIAFSCLWRQAFGEKARKTPVSAITLKDVIRKITNGDITEWADRNLLLTVLAGSVPKASPVAAAPAPSVSRGSAGTGTAKPAATPSPPEHGSHGPVAAQTVAPPSRKPADPDKQRKLRELLKGAKVQP